MCRPGHGSSQDPSTGGHIGPPLRGPKGIREPTEIDVKGRATGRDGARPLRGERSRAVRPGTAGCSYPALRKRHRWCTAVGRCRHRPLRPAGGRGTARRVVVPYGWLRRAAAIALGSGAQRSVCASGCEEWAGIDARIIPKGGPPPQLPRQRLAKRKARKEQLVKFRFCPIPSERSTAYYARKSQQSPARVLVGAAVTEQDRLAPHPAARQGAPRP